MLTKQELDDIWDNKPYGHFTKLIKQYKGTKKYEVTVKAFRYEMIGEEKEVVRAKDSTAAQYHAEPIIARLCVNNNLWRWDKSITFKSAAVEVK